MSAKRLDSRGIVAISGADAPAFLHGLVTADIEKMPPGGTAFGAFLTPQGKILFDFIVHSADGIYLIDLPGLAIEPFIKRLGLYRLRSKVDIADASQHYGVVIDTVGDAGPKDPRLADLGARYVVNTGNIPDEDATFASNAMQTRLGIAECWRDFNSGEIFPHEANFDRLHGVDFSKGCYVGQEVVSRMHHRGTSRKRFLPCRTEGPPPPAGAGITANGRNAGVSGLGASATEGQFLALLRLDRITEAVAGKTPLMCGETKIWPEFPLWMQDPKAAEEEIPQ